MSERGGPDLILERATSSFYTRWFYIYTVRYRVTFTLLFYIRKQTLRYMHLLYIYIYMLRKSQSTREMPSIRNIIDILFYSSLSWTSRTILSMTLKKKKKKQNKNAKWSAQIIMRGHELLLHQTQQILSSYFIYPRRAVSSSTISINYYNTEPDYTNFFFFSHTYYYILMYIIYNNKPQAYN